MKYNKKIKDQVIVFDRKVFKNKTQIKEWLRKNNFKYEPKKPISKYKKSYRYRFKNPYRFIRKTLKECYLAKGVMIVKGKIKHIR